MASTGGKRCALLIEQKLEILEALKSKRAGDVMKYFIIGYSTVNKIRQNKEGIRKMAHRQFVAHVINSCIDLCFFLIDLCKLVSQLMK